MSRDARRGAITVAIGERYHRYAVSLARSLRRHAPGLPLAVVTDAAPSVFGELVDHVVAARPEFGHGYRQKLHLDHYTPFEQTLFLDADCLAVRDPAPAFDLFADVPVGVIGGPHTSGHWFMDIARVCREQAVPSIPKFNGGLMFLSGSAECRAILDDARSVMATYDEVGLERINGLEADEPALAVALARHDVPAKLDYDHGVLMRTPIGATGPVLVDALAGSASFDRGSGTLHPAVVHFAGWTRSHLYARECLALALADRLPDPWARAAADRLYRPVVHRVVSRLRRR
jgi:hypothetical protein